MRRAHTSYENIALVCIAPGSHTAGMKLFTSPLACSMASRIALDELGRSVELVQIDHTTRLPPSGEPIHPLGMVPVLHTDDGHVLTENSAILQYVATGTHLVPEDAWQRSQLQQWLSFIATELHKVVFIPLLTSKAPDGAKAWALANADARLAIVDRHLAGRTWLLDTYSIADIYLATVLNWTRATPIELARFPALVAFQTRILERPAVKAVLAAELAAYLAEHHAPAAPSTRAVLDRFNDVFQRHDPAALDQLVGDGCVIDNTDGKRHTGKAACIALWTAIATDPEISFDLEAVEADEGRGVIQWTLRSNHAPVIHGVNIMQIEHGRITHARGYTRPMP